MYTFRHQHVTPQSRELRCTRGGVEFHGERLGDKVMKCPVSLKGRPRRDEQDRVIASRCCYIDWRGHLYIAPFSLPGGVWICMGPDTPQPLSRCYSCQRNWRGRLERGRGKWRGRKEDRKEGGRQGGRERQKALDNTRPTEYGGDLLPMSQQTRRACNSRMNRTRYSKLPFLLCQFGEKCTPS